MNDEQKSNHFNEKLYKKGAIRRSLQKLEYRIHVSRIHVLKIHVKMSF